MADGQAQASQRQSQPWGQNRHSGSNSGSSWEKRKQSGDRRERSGDRREQSGDRRERSGDRQEQSGDRRERSGDRREPSGDRKDRYRDGRDWPRNQPQQRHPNQQSNYHYGMSHHQNYYQYNDGNHRHNYPTHGGRGSNRGRGRGGFGNPPPEYMGSYSMQDQFSHYGGSDQPYFETNGQMQNFGHWGQQGNMGNQNWQGQYFQRQQQYNTGNSSQSQGSRQRDEDDTVFLSKTLSYILRHGAEKQGFQLMKGGFLYVDEILKRTQKLRGFTVKDVERVVQTNDKQRFALERDENGWLKIRANQGHTIEVDDLDLEEITLPLPEDLTDVIHGTYFSSWEIIKKFGLSRMNRNHVHFAPGEPGENGVISGMRKTCEVLIYVDIEKALKDGLKFYRSANNVILCPGDDKGIIYPCYFSEALNRSPRQKLDFDNTITKDTVKHEPMANAGKYAGKKKDKAGNIPVGGVPEPESKKKKKKNKRKNKDKEMDEGQTEFKDDTTEGESKPAAKKKAVEDQKEIPETWDCDEETRKLEKSENGVQEGSQIGCETDCAGEYCGSNTNISSSKKTDEITGFSGNSAVKEEEHETEQATHEEGQDLNNSLASSSSMADAESSSVGAEAGPKVDSELTIIADGDQSISAVEHLRERKPEVMAVCCYGDNLGKEKSKIYLLVLITDDLAYIYHLPGDNDEVIKKGHVKELFEDPKINKVFNRIGPQSLSIAHEWDILLDGTPIWDLTILYDKLYKNLPNKTLKFIEENNLDPNGWTDDELTSRMRNHDMDKDIQPKLLQRGRDMLKLYRQFHMDQMKSVKRLIYEAASPHEGFMSDKIKLLKEQRRKENRKKKEKEEKNQQSKQQFQSPKKHGKKKKN